MILDILVIGAGIALISYPYYKEKMVDYDSKYCFKCEEKRREPYCEKCGSKTEKKTIEADWSDGFRISMAERITPEDAEIVTSEDKKEAMEETYEFNKEY